MRFHTFVELLSCAAPLTAQQPDFRWEKALPTGQSDANHPAAVKDSGFDFWTLLKDMDNQKQLPAEIFVPPLVNCCAIEPHHAGLAGPDSYQRL